MPALRLRPYANACSAALLLLGLPGCSRSEREKAEGEAGSQAHSLTDGPAVIASRASERAEQAKALAYSSSGEGWASEAYADHAHRFLADLLTHSPARESVPGVSEDFVGTAILPPALREIYSDKWVTVRRADAEATSDSIRGRARFLEQLREFRSTYDLAAEVAHRIKVVGVELTDRGVRTQALWSCRASLGDGSVTQQRAAWECLWQGIEPGAAKLAAIQVSDFEELTSTRGNWFIDDTTKVIGTNQSFSEQLALGLNHWLQRIETSHGMSLYARYGIAVGDVNGDLLDDLYVCQPGGLPNRLFVHRPDGSAVDRSRESAVDWLDHSSAALIVDIDNDGDRDLAIATHGGLLILENDSHGVFEPRGRMAMRDTDVQSLVAADFDRDGDLDFYVCSGFSSPGAEVPQFEYHDANDGGANVLFRNEGDWRFTDATREVGLDANNRRHSLAAAWRDFDRDGDQDLYVANDYGQNCLYRNDGGHFTDVAPLLGVVDHGSGMSASWGDSNRDGWSDLYIANMFSAAGRRITSQPQFRSADDAPTRRLFQRFAKGNTLFVGNAGVGFKETGPGFGAVIGDWAWGSVFADIDNDGWEDIVVANGYITGSDPGDL